MNLNKIAKLRFLLAVHIVPLVPGKCIATGYPGEMIEQLEMVIGRHLHGMMVICPFSSQA